MSRNKRPPINSLAWGLALGFVTYRLLKLAAVVSFFRRRPLPAPSQWHSITLLEPVTQSDNDVARILRTRFEFDYPGTVQHVFVCDADDLDSQVLCSTLCAEFNATAALIVARAGGAPHASKIEKLQAGLAHAHGDILVFVDDDIMLRPDALRVFATFLSEPNTGAVFGLACYTNWQNLWSGLMSSFVNSNALLSYIPITYLTEPFTVTGQCFALVRHIFYAVGGLSDMDGRLDDDHEMARRVRRKGLRIVLTPVVYDVDNFISSAHAYRAQMKRWFVIPRQTMLPGMTKHERNLTFVSSADTWIPPVLAGFALATQSREAWFALGAVLGALYGVNALLERGYTHRRTPLMQLPLLAASALISPLFVLRSLLGNDEIEWRGQKIKLHHGGKYEVQK